MTDSHLFRIIQEIQLDILDCFLLSNQIQFDHEL